MKLRWLRRYTLEYIPDAKKRAGGPKSKPFKRAYDTLQYLPTGLEEIERNWRDVDTHDFGEVTE